MPSVKISQGLKNLNVNYTVSTPTNAHASEIDPKLPIVILIHPVYTSACFYHPQFADARIRRFNLIAYDLRGHGGTSGPVGKSFDREDGAKDLAQFLDKLKIKVPVFVLGVSMGSVIGTQFAVSYPNRCCGLMAISPLPTPDLEEALAGREEVYNLWTEGWNGKKPNMEVLGEAFRGALELAFNGSMQGHNKTLLAVCGAADISAFTPGQGHKDMRALTVDFFGANAKPWTAAEVKALARIPCLLMHFSGDIAYPLETAETVEEHWSNNAVQVGLIKINGGCHFGTFTLPQLTNRYIEQFISNNSGKEAASCPRPVQVTSPWDDVFKSPADSDEE